MLPLTIELLHVGSLVIDDIEDDSRTRRGEPTLHRRYGLPLALNTGNWLYFLAYGLVSKLPLSDQIRLALYEDMSLGLLRCHQGQALDLSVRITEVPRARVPDIVRATTRLKTGALMRLAATLGARAAGGAPACVSVIGEYGTELGVGLQMLDDWSGLSVEERRDKGLEDLRLARPTWPWAWLAESADEFRYAELNREARRASIEWEVARVRSVLSETLAPVARERVRGQLGSTISVLRSGLGDVEGLSEVRDELEALERAYN